MPAKNRLKMLGNCKCDEGNVNSKILLKIPLKIKKNKQNKNEDKREKRRDQAQGLRSTSRVFI